MSVSFEVSYTVARASSETPDHKATPHADGGKWAPVRSFGTAHVDLSFGAELSIHSMSFTASGCSSVKVVLQGA